MQPTTHLGAARLASLAIVAVFLLSQSGFAAAEQPSSTQIIEALKPKPLTRSLSRSVEPPAQSAAEKQFIDSLRKKPTRAITIEERKQVAVIAKARPSIDLEVTFDFDSAVISPHAYSTLHALGTALRNQQFSGVTFLLAGHTDAQGSADYNQALSERRAIAVKQYLYEKYGLPLDSLIAVGYGKEQPKNKYDPYAAENRRVQIANMEAKH